MTPPRAEQSNPLRRVFGNAVAAAVMATLALILTALIVPGLALLALRWYLLVIGAIAVITGIGAMIFRYPVQWQSTDPTMSISPEPPEEPARLRAFNRLVARSGWDRSAFQIELRPILRAIAAQRLATYRTIDMDADPAAARAALGERAWALLTTVDLVQARGERGIAASDLAAVVEALEKLDVTPRA